MKIGSITVADNGVGIRPEDKPRLFEPYFSTKKSGTGLGLAIVSRIVSDHNGFIRVLDNQPTGAVFVVELPVRTEKFAGRAHEYGAAPFAGEGKVRA